MPRHRRVRAAAAALALLALPGCQAGRLQFQNDHRLSFQSPEARHRVSAPFTVDWTMRDFTPTGLDGGTGRDRGVFAVFVDRAPMPVGKDLRWLFRSDTGCKHDARCPSAQQLADRGVLVTTDTHVTVDVLPQVGEGVGDEQHYVNVVLLDGTGHRIGESGWYLPFTSKRRSV
ncbi:MAG TPA: hypothetical protein VMZ11_05945 [Mycobacteriales bacterium]|nr:hypothetical protein [Mycobacteriales bacterium]